MSPQVAGDGLLVGGDLAGQRRDGLGRGGRAEPVGATLLPGQPRRHDLEAAGAGEAEAEWLVDLDATHSRRVDARLARRQQTAARVQAAQAVAGQPEAPEGEHVGRHGEGRDEDQDEEHVDPPGEPAHPLGALDDGLALVAEAGEALGEEAETCGSRGEARRRERCVADPGRIEPQQHLFVGHGRHVDAGDEAVDVDGSAGRRGQTGDLRAGAVEQLGTQPATLVDEQRVEHEPVALAPTGRDLDLDQAEHAVVQLRGEVDRAHLVEAGRRRLLVEQSALQLDLPIDDAVARRHPSHHPEGDDDGQRDELPALVARRSRSGR